MDLAGDVSVSLMMPLENTEGAASKLTTDVVQGPRVDHAPTASVISEASCGPHKKRPPVSAKSSVLSEPNEHEHKLRSLLANRTLREFVYPGDHQKAATLRELVYQGDRKKADTTGDGTDSVTSSDKNSNAVRVDDFSGTCNLDVWEHIFKTGDLTPLHHAIEEECRSRGRSSAQLIYKCLQQLIASDFVDDQLYLEVCAKLPLLLVELFRARSHRHLCLKDEYDHLCKAYRLDQIVDYVPKLVRPKDSEIGQLHDRSVTAEDGTIVCRFIKQDDYSTSYDEKQLWHEPKAVVCQLLLSQISKEHHKFWQEWYQDRQDEDKRLAVLNDEQRVQALQKRERHLKDVKREVAQVRDLYNVRVCTEQLLAMRIDPWS